MSPTYNFGINLYLAAVKIASLRNPKARLMLEGRKKTFPRLPEGKWAWFHASSLGEFEQGRPMMEMLREKHPDIKILLTFFSPSGYEVRKNWSGADMVAYLPFDKPKRVKEFLDACHPDVAVFIKYEFWGNFLQQLAQRNIPVYLISGIFRKNQIFFRPYGRIMRDVLKSFHKLFVQDQNSKDLLQSIGITNVQVTGDTRHDRVAQIANQKVSLPEVEAFLKGYSKEKVMVFGSSWPEDERLYIPWLKSHPDIKAIIAPHEFDNSRLNELQASLGREQCVLWSEFEKIPHLEDKRYLIVDCFGKLSSLYRYGSMAYVGGGFGKGIHNIVEAAVYGIPVVFGPNHLKFQEAYGLIEAGGGFSVSDSSQLTEVFNQFTTSTEEKEQAGKAAGTYVAEHTGATGKIFNQIFS